MKARNNDKESKICLTCNNPFTSLGPHNRICRKCRHLLTSTYTPSIHKTYRWGGQR